MKSSADTVDNRFGVPYYLILSSECILLRNPLSVATTAA